MMVDRLISDTNYKIHRYNFNKEIMELLSNFAKIHKYDTRKDYQEAWKEWYTEHIDELQREGQRIINLGYIGDIEEKMYKAARYYFRKKNKVNPDTYSEKEVKVRTYVALSPILLKNMDSHIKNNITNNNYSPAWGFADFCKNNKVVLENEILSLNIKYEKNYIVPKIKKTYKNRYFQYINSK